jgi:hypothetical protein
MSENSDVISKEDAKRLVELLDELEEILESKPDDTERLKKIYEELIQIRSRMPNSHNQNCG